MVTGVQRRRWYGQGSRQESQRGDAVGSIIVTGQGGSQGNKHFDRSLLLSLQLTSAGASFGRIHLEAGGWEDPCGLYKLAGWRWTGGGGGWVNLEGPTEEVPLQDR